MKTCFVIILALLACDYAKAQVPPPHTDTTKIIRICTPSRESALSPPLYVVFKGDKVIYKTNAAIPNIHPTDIASIEVLKGNSATEKYGKAALYGVIEIHLKKGAKPDTGKLNTDTGKVIKYRQR